MIRAQGVLAVLMLLLLAAGSADAQPRGRFGGGMGGLGMGAMNGGDDMERRMCIPSTMFMRCLDHCFAQMGGPGDALDHNHCTKKCANKICPS